MARGLGRRSRTAPVESRSIKPRDHRRIWQLLSQASAESCEPMPRGSNYTFLVKLSLDDKGSGWCPQATCPEQSRRVEGVGVYKPRRGETPLWDFPPGTLYKREYAAYLLSEALGWHFVPPTVIWEGPYGVGSLQLFIDSVPRATYFDLRETHITEIKRIAAFDIIANNADRKGGHCVRDQAGKVWGIDHGLTFHVESKLRTVIWDFGGEPVPQEVLDGVAKELRGFYAPGGLAQGLKGVLDDREIDALAERMQLLLDRPRFPEIKYRWDVPWPLI